MNFILYEKGFASRLWTLQITTVNSRDHEREPESPQP